MTCMAAKTNKVWFLEKYARFVPDTATVASTATENSRALGKWQHYPSKDMRMQLSLLESDHLVISCGTKIYESFSLWETRKWLKGVMKGDSILFVYRLGDENRRFRVKFSAPGLSATPSDACKNFAETVGSFINIRDITVATNFTSYSQMCYEDSQVNTLAAKSVSMETDSVPEDSVMSIQDIGKAMVTSQGYSLGRAYAETNFPTAQLGAFIRLCLTDSNFPGFVESVEKELNSMLEKPGC